MQIKRRFEIAAAILFLAVIVTGCVSTFAGTGRTAALIPPEKEWTSPLTATEAPEPIATLAPQTPTPEPTETVDKLPLYDVPMSDELQGYLFGACEETGVPFEFALALIGNESGYQTEVISTTSDYGLMQINSCNHDWLKEELGVEDFLDPEENITAGLYILSGYFEKYEDPHMVLMAYNMGEYGAKKQWDKGVYQSGYSRRVMERLDELERKEGDQ